MPLYSYECPEHGHFKEMKPLRLYKEKADCPDCGKPSERVISIPFIAIPSCTDGVKASQAHENDIRKRYVRPDGEVGREGDRFHEATMKDLGHA